MRASAGVFALLGADLCLTLEHVLALLASLQRAPEWMVAIGRFCVPINVLQALLLLPALQEARAVVVLVEAERRALATGASVSVDHAAHLAGFGWGVCCYLLFREARCRGWAAPWRQLTRRVRRGGGAPAGGRRVAQHKYVPAPPWSAHVNKENGKEFFHNWTTGESTYNWPVAAPLHGHAV